MSPQPTEKTPPTRRIFRKRYMLVCVALLVLLAYLAAPRRVRDIVTVDGLQRWAEDVAPPQYKIIWQEAKNVDAGGGDLDAGDSLIRPQLAEDGTALYFTLRKTGGDADIYRTQKEDGKWLPAKPVAELNTAADEVGPVFRADGQRLYLYSDREGGYGGFDIYACDRTKEGWSEPRNLGPRINSPAHEYDPAVSADGLRLLFASNRTPRMDRQIAASETGELPDHWSTTLRADLGLTNFDLYMARRTSEEEQWAAAKPLVELNVANANEGSPYFSPAHTFVYFVSDRIERQGEEINFDIYRARIVGDRVSDVENLGGGVNTSANEIEPALSVEGFQLYFSRNEQPAGETKHAGDAILEDQYTLYRSEATEIFEEVGWGDSRLGWLLSFVARNAWWLMMILLTLALLAALIWYAREVSLRRLPVPGFFLIALLIHLLMGFTSFYVYFGEQIVAEIKKEFEQITVTANLSENLHQSHEEGSEAYEKISDLKAVETVNPESVIRQVSEMPNVPIPTKSPAPEIQTKLERELPPDRLIASMPQATVEAATPKLDRRRSVLDQTPQELVEMERPNAVEQEQENQIERKQVEFDRRQPVQRTAALPKMPQRRAIKAAMAVEPVELAAETPTEQLVTTTNTRRPEIARSHPVPATPVESVAVVQESLASPQNQPEVPTAPQQVSVDVGQRETVMSMAPRRKRFRPKSPGEAQLQLALSEMSVPTLQEQGDVDVFFSKDNPLSTPTRRAAPKMEADNPQQIAVMAATAATTSDAKSTESTSMQGVQVKAARRTEATAPPQAAAPRFKAAEKPAPVGIASTPQPDRPRATAPKLTEVKASLTRTRRGTEGAKPEVVAMEQSTQAPRKATSGEKKSIAGLDVGLNRPDVQMASLDVKTAGAFGGRHNPRNPNLIVGSLANEAVDAVPTFSPMASRIDRRPARAPSLMYAEDNIGLQAMFRMRQGEDKAVLVKTFGGRGETLDTVKRGLVWLARHQNADGHWSFEKFYNEQPGKSYSGQGSVKSDAAATGFALLPFLGDGHTHVAGDHRQTVRKAVDWLVKNQEKDGSLAKGSGGNSYMYTHGIATIALCEAYGMSKDPKLRDPAQKAINFIVSAQHKPSGGWRYQPNQQGDTSVVGWQVMAMKSGQMASLDVAEQSLELVHKWLKSVEGSGANAGRFGYQNPSPSLVMTAEGLLCLQYLGVDKNDRRIQAGTKYLVENLPNLAQSNGDNNSYYWYYGTQVMFHMQGQQWQRWNAAMCDMLVDSQIKDGHLAGTWENKAKWEREGGRIYATSLRLLMLEVYYRHLPLYSLPGK